MKVVPLIVLPWFLILAVVAAFLNHWEWTAILGWLSAVAIVISPIKAAH